MQNGIVRHRFSQAIFRPAKLFFTTFITITFILTLIRYTRTGLISKKRTANLFSEALSEPALETVRNASFLVEKRPVVIVTALTVHSVPFLENLRCWMRRQSAGKLVVFGLDEDMVEYGSKNGFATVAVAREKETRERDFGEKSFDSATRRKLGVVHSVLMAGFDVMFTDVDIVWCEDCAIILAKMAAENKGRETIFLQSDTAEEGNNLVRSNSGFYFVRSSANSVRLFKKMVTVARKKLSENDKFILNTVSCLEEGKGRKLSMKEHGKGPLATVCLWDNVLELETLPLAKYPNGATVFGETKVFDLKPGVVQKWCQQRNLFMLHNNFIVGHDKKKERFQRSGLWIWDDRNYQCYQEC